MHYIDILVHFFFDLLFDQKPLVETFDWQLVTVVVLRKFLYLVPFAVWIIQTIFLATYLGVVVSVWVLCQFFRVRLLMVLELESINLNPNVLNHFLLYIYIFWFICSKPLVPQNNFCFSKKLKCCFLWPWWSYFKDSKVFSSFFIFRGILGIDGVNQLFFLSKTYCYCLWKNKFKLACLLAD